MKHDFPAEYQIAREHCSQLGVSIDRDFYEKSKIFAELLVECSRRINLIGPKEPSRLWARHVLESVAFAPYLSSREFVDIGTGAGFPGFILSLLGYSATLVEPRAKRCGFLETAARECGAVSCTVIEARIENIGPFGCDTQFTARAVKEPAVLLKHIEGISRGGFTLLTRVSGGVQLPKGSIVAALPSPPLDREGFILQYSHSH